MSGLVGYESSDDDDDELERSRQVLEPHELVRSSAINALPEEQEKPLNVSTEINPLATAKNGPIMGPVIASGDFESYEAYDKADDVAHDFTNLSNRDALRYLTQSHHPMTETPPSPPGSPDMKATARIRKFLDLKSKAVHFHEDLATKSAYMNPSLFDTLLNRAGVDGHSQYKTSLPIAVFDPTSLPPFAYKEELFRSQQTIRKEEEAKVKAQSAAGTRTIDFVSKNVQAETV